MHGDPVPDTYVYVTEEGVTRHYADGSVEALAWEDVVEVRVGGDFEVDVHYILLDRDGQGCVVPRSATDASFLTRLRYLPDFDLDRLAVAVERVGEEEQDLDVDVVVWRSPDPPTPLPDLEYD
ncbi:hypothetical protein Ssi02_37520 [Sinosporangium siamense]|uniref:Uncharacterized protein n=1 Tax=Sinosporangium siamense TaxID=1367973 RepID=A0A919RK59_9ACTN|nr:hypothetical protein Ssi02_37520 [Sinosporangium siamense]